MWRGGSNAFSPVLCPPESSVFVASDLLRISVLRLFWVYPVVSFEVFEMIEPPPRRKGGCLFWVRDFVFTNR